MFRPIRVILFVATVPLFLQPLEAQTTPDAVPAQTVHRRSVAGGKLVFPCYAKEVHPPRTFSPPWRTRAVNGPEDKRVTVVIGFDDPNPDFPFDCVGEPLQINVPNGQIVNLVKENWMDGCTPTLSITPAVADSIVSDLLTLVVKVGAFGLDGQSYYYELPPLKNKILTVTVACTIVKTATQPARKLTQTVSITYQNPPRIVVSAGLLVSTEGVKSYSIVTTKTGVDPKTGIATTQNSIGTSGNSSAQVIPFGFVNWYWAGSRKLSVASQFGIGVNPNLSTPKIEFFAAPLGIAWHDFYFAPGIHFGQHEKLTGGFAQGDIVSGLSKPPIGWKYETGLAFSLSYNLKPLKPATPAAK